MTSHPLPPQVVQIDDYGPIFKLREPFTATMVQASAKNAKPAGLCRLKHRWQTIGDTYFPEDDPHTLVLSLIASRTHDRLVRCRRCGTVAMRPTP